MRGWMPLLAHEKWFINPAEYPLRLDQSAHAPTLWYITAVVVAVGIIGAVWIIRRRREIVPGPRTLGADSERLCGFFGLVPLILAIHLGVPLLVAGTQRNLFTVNNHVEGPAGYFVGLVEVGCALSLLYGAMARVSALLLSLLWALGFYLSGPQAMLDNVHILGLAGFFYLAGRGPIALDRLLFPELEPSATKMRLAIPVARIGLGAGLSVVAFTEKLANLPMALAFLQKYPVNFTGFMHLPMSDQTFVLCAGSVELLVGLMILFNIFTRTITIIAWIPINLSLSYFNWNWTELVGHLPIYGVLAILLIWEPDGSSEPLWVRGLRHGPLKILDDKHEE